MSKIITVNDKRLKMFIVKNQMRVHYNGIDKEIRLFL